MECVGFPQALRVDLHFLNHLPLVSGRSSAYGDAAAEGHPAGPGSVSSSTGAISTATGHQEGDGSEGEGDGEGEADVHASNRSGPGRRRAWTLLGGRMFEGEDGGSVAGDVEVTVVYFF